MNTIRYICILILTTDMSNRMISRLVGISHNTVRSYRDSLLIGGFTAMDINDMDDTELEAVLKCKRGRIENKQIPDWEAIHREKQVNHMTLQLLWEEYREANPDNAYSYSQFTHYYRNYVGKLDLSMRQTHLAGECVFVDYMGRTLSYTDPETSEEHTVQLFIGVFGCSNYTFLYATHTQSLPDWIEAHNRMFQFYGGVPQIIVPDNLKSAVTYAGREPTINRTYLDLARYYGVVIVPTRVRHPKDKPKAEGGVLIAYRWILLKLRHRKFFSLEEINKAIAELLRQLNERPFKKLPGCRRSRFEEMDKPLLRPIPGAPFEYAEWTSARKVGQDYHLPIDQHYYSVPHELVSQKVETRTTKNIVEFIHKGKRVASHPRSYVVGGNTTIPAHQPKAHRQYANLTPENLLAWARNIGPASEAAVQYQFDSRPHAMLGIRSCSTLKRLAKDYGYERFEAACKRAEMIGSLTVKSIRSILQRKLAELPEDEMPIQINLPLHQNVRGSAYYENRSD